MTVQELRIGNWVNYMMIDGQFHPQKIKSGQQIDEMGHYQPEPIPLTPELLEKAGFTPEYRREDTTLYKMDRISIDLDLGGWFYYEDTAIEDVDVKYVHQLQNLFYCLTGQELEINL